MLTDTKDSFVDVKFEMNALDIAADNGIRLIANVKPLRITYNAVSNVTTMSSLYVCVCVCSCVYVCVCVCVLPVGHWRTYTKGMQGAIAIEINRLPNMEQ